MANPVDFILRDGVQVTNALVVGSYFVANTAPGNGAIISGNVGIGTANPSLQLVVQNDISATAYYADLNVPNIAPTLKLNFVSPNNQLDSRITFTRASNATVVSSSGNITIISNNVPAFDNDPSTYQPLGLRIESSQTNYITNSKIFTGAMWTGTRVSIGAPVGNVAAPDGSYTAVKISEDTSTNTHYLRGTLPSTVTSGSYYTASFYIKAAERTQAGVVFQSDNSAFGPSGFYVTYDLVSGTRTFLSGTNNLIASGSTYAGNGWWRIWASSQAQNTAVPVIGMALGNNNQASYTGDGTSGVYVWGAQFESNIYPTSYIPTTTATATRAADLASLSPISSWFNTSQGMLRATAQPTYTIDTNYQTIARIRDSATNQSSLAIQRTPSGGNSYNYNYVVDNGSVVFSSSYAQIWGNSNVYTISVSYNSSSGIYSSSSNATPYISTVSSASLWQTVVPDKLEIGSNNSVRFLDGYIKNLSYYPASQPNVIVQNFSVP